MFLGGPSPGPSMPNFQIRSVDVEFAIFGSWPPYGLSRVNGDVRPRPVESRARAGALRAGAQAPAMKHL